MYKALAQANPDLGGPHANLGVIYRQSGKVNESVGELEQAVKLSPRQPIYLNQLGIAYRPAGPVRQVARRLPARPRPRSGLRRGNAEPGHLV